MTVSANLLHRHPELVSGSISRFTPKPSGEAERQRCALYSGDEWAAQWVLKQVQHDEDELRLVCQ